MNQDLENEYYFSQQGIIFAYQEGKFAGVFVTEADESFTREELLECFEDSADYLVAADLSEWAMVNSEEELQERLHFLIERAMAGDHSHLTIMYHIPKTVH